MKNAYRFPVTVDIPQEELFFAVAYSSGMIGCEEQVQSEDSLSYLCYFSTEEEADLAIQALFPHCGEIGSIEFVEDQDWNEEWKKTVEPIKAAKGVWVSPEWLTPPLEDGDNWIKIEPRRAFGTGHHETTRLASQAVLDNAVVGGSLLDIGTGSGVLLFVAQIAGYSSAVGVENDPDCDENLAENLAANMGPCEISYHIDTTDCLSKDLSFDTVVMNIIRSESEPILPAVKHFLAEGGRFVWSGILVSERDIIVSAAEREGFSLLKEYSEGEWWIGAFVHA